MIKKLHEIKKLGACVIQVFYGDDVDCDYFSTKLEEQELVVLYMPKGLMRGVKNLWKGKYKDFITFDFTSSPIKISNPPESYEYEHGGFFYWESD